MTAIAIERLKEDFPALYEWLVELDVKGCLIPMTASKKPTISFAGNKPLPRLPDDCKTYGIEVSRAGLAVLDLDRNHADGADGVTTYRKLAKERGSDDSAALWQKTPSGGYQKICLAPRGRGVKSRNDLAKYGLAGIDIKGSGIDGTKTAYVLGPGSDAYLKRDGVQTKEKARYMPVADVLPLDDFPLWLLAMIDEFDNAARDAKLKEVQASYGGTNSGLTPYKRKIVENICKEMRGAAMGSIDSTMNALVFKLGKSGIRWEDFAGEFVAAALDAGATPAHANDAKWKNTWSTAFSQYDPSEDKDYAVNPPNPLESGSTAETPKKALKAADEGEVPESSEALAQRVYAKYTPDDFFAASANKNGNNVTTGNLLSLFTARAVLEVGPLLSGKDGYMYAYRDGVYNREDSPVDERLTRLMGDRFRGGYKSSVEPHVRVLSGRIDCEKPPEEFINFKNGLLNWRDLEISHHTPDVGSTVQLSVNWNPDATCPKFDKFLAEVLPEDAIETMWEIIGYSMYSGNPLQTAAMFVGEGGNGKGTVLRVIRGILGDHNISAVSLDELNDDAFASADLYGKIANIAADIDGNYMTRTAEFKKITGGDAIRGQHKGKDSFLFECWAFPMFSANRIPGSSDTSEGYYRRWLIIEFPNKIAKRDYELDDKLATEYEGIAAKAVLYLRRLMKRKAWTCGMSVQRAKREFERKTDHIRDFLDDATGPEARLTHCATPSATFEHYLKWCEENNHSRPLTKRSFYTRMESAGHKRAVTRGIQKFTNLRLRTLDVDRVIEDFDRDDDDKRATEDFDVILEDENLRIQK